MNLYFFKQVLELLVVVSVNVFFVSLLLRFTKRYRNDTKTKRMLTFFAVGSAALFCISQMVFFAVSVKQYSYVDIEQLPQFEVTSQSLANGVWEDQISHTSKGENLSPQLHFEPVNGAMGYVIVMIDPDGNNWLHWIDTVTETELPEGFSEQRPDTYIGPYPPSGTHHYTVYVFACGSHLPDTEKFVLDKAGKDIREIAYALDATETDDRGNLIAVGTLTGTYRNNE